MIHIRLARKEDIQNIMPLYAYARKFMAANGNPHQWNGNYPASEDILKDIANGNYYVCTPENAPEKIVGGFAFIIGREPNYAVIENGAWHSDQPYGTIHRIAPFRHPRITAYLRLPVAFRSLSRLSSAPSAKAFALRPF